MPNHFGWLLVVLGLVIAALGLLWIAIPHLPWVGRLPGDIVWEKGNTRFYFPLTTCILLSLILTSVIWIVRQFVR